MKVQQTFQFRGYTTKDGYRRIDEILALNCRLYNAALQQRIEFYNWYGKTFSFTDAEGNEQEFKRRDPGGTVIDAEGNRRVESLHPGGRVSFRGQSQEYTQLKTDMPEYEAISRRVQVGTLYRLDKAFDAFFRRVKAGESPGFPRYKSVSRWRTIEPRGVEAAWLKPTPDGKRANIKLAGLPRIEIKLKRPLPEGYPKSFKITRKHRGLTVSLTYEVEKKPESTTGAMVGIDRGVKSLIATSDDEWVPGIKRNHKRRRRLLRKLERQRQAALDDGRATWQRLENRQVLPAKPITGKNGKPRFRLEWKDGQSSRKYQQTRNRLANSEAREQVAIRNQIHRITTSLVRQYDWIFVEDLAITNMTRSAKGTLENPGKRVKQKTGLNREILAQRWGLILSQLDYKAGWAGKTLLHVDPAYTSQTCSGCGMVQADHRQGERYVCSGCGLALNADVNAAINILRRGQASAGLKPRPDAPQYKLPLMFPLGERGARENPRLHGTRGFPLST